MKLNDYQKINLAIVFSILFIVIYAIVYPYLGGLQIASSCVEFDFCHCKSKGLSRAFAQIVRMDLDTALQFNPFAIRIFLFFSIHLLLRSCFVFLKNTKSKFQLVDFSFSLLSILLVFLPLNINMCS